MFDDNTVTFNLAVMLRTMDIELSVDHVVKLSEEGFSPDLVDEAVEDGLLTEIDGLTEQIDDLSDAYANLFEERAHFAERLKEFNTIY